MVGFLYVKTISIRRVSRSGRLIQRVPLQGDFKRVISSKGLHRHTGINLTVEEWTLRQNEGLYQILLAVSDGVAKIP